MIRAVIFDFDGLILDTETLWYQCYREVLGGKGVELPLEVFARCIGTHDQSLQQFIREKGCGEDILELNRQAGLLLDRRVCQLDLRDGVKEYLVAAKSNGLKIGLASSSNRDWVEGFLRRFAIYDQFDIVKTRDDVENVKPDPELYSKALSELGVSGDEAFAFEDSLNGLNAARAAGLRCVVVPNQVTCQMAFAGHELLLESMGNHPLEYILDRLNNTGGGAAI
jgi:putative hydrolase of the HAD superfamily